MGVGEGGEPESNNLVYTKRPKDMYAKRKHKTTCIAYYYTPLYENAQKWERKSPMETTFIVTSAWNTGETGDMNEV